VVDRVQVYVVRDKAIGVGGELVPDLAAFKKKVMSTAVGNDWMLVLAIHGSEDRLRPSPTRTGRRTPSTTRPRISTPCSTATPRS
jgi:hypothetical protein